MRALLRLIAALLLLLVPALVQAQAPDSKELMRAWELSRGQERILSFVSAVKVERSGDLDVTETIRIVSLAQEIKRGIQRDFPTSYDTVAGQHTRVGFSVVSVQRDGKDEPFERMSLSNGVRIRIGQADVMLPPGEHVYVIRYRTTRQMIYGDKHDELYWNVTGSGWTFPIDMAEARITLPSPAQFGDRAAYTGAQGSTDRNAAVVEEKPGYIVFRTTKPLGREQGLTVAAAFPKGVLDAPGTGRKAQWWLDDWGALLAALVAFVVMLGYYFRAWLKAGRNPRAGTVVPLFSPPDDLTPAAARYISRMGFDNRAFSAAIVDLGVRGQIHMTQEEGGWLSKGTTTLERTDVRTASSDRVLPAPETAMRDRLFTGAGSDGVIELKQENHKTLQAARSALEKGLEKAYLGTMYKKNSEWAVFGLVMIPVTMVAIALFAILTTSAIDPYEKWGLLVATLLAVAATWGMVKVAATAKGCLCVVLWIVTIGLGLVAAALGLAMVIEAMVAGAVAMFLPLLLLPLAISAFWWMYAPTREGRAMMDRIAGFKQYLSIAEEQRLEAMHPPEKTPELFERYLPFAIALDVENRWAERFAGVLAAAAAAGATAHTYSWYTGQNNIWDNPQSFASTVGSSLASTVSSASSSPSSSSGGSSGGGSSGGGGGGGGGSGW